LFPTLSHAAHVGSDAERQIAAQEARKLGHSQARLDEDEQDRPVPPTNVRRAVRRSEKRVDLGSSQIANDDLVSPFRGDGEHTLNERACSGWRRAAKRYSEWIAANLALRVEMETPRSRSR